MGKDNRRIQAELHRVTAARIDLEVRLEDMDAERQRVLDAIEIQRAREKELQDHLSQTSEQK